MYLSVAGKIANNLWHEIVNHAKNVKLDKFVVMPNHVHGILILGKSAGDELDGYGDGVVNADIMADGDTMMDVNMMVDTDTMMDVNMMVETSFTCNPYFK
jgi:hypothetical protein